MTDALEIVETLPPMHPGELLREEFMAPLGLTAYAVAKACGVPRTRIERIVAEEVGISGDTAIRLGRLFRTTAQFWMNAQTNYELQLAQAEIGSAVNDIVPADAAA